MKATDRALARIMLAAAPVMLMAAPAAAQQSYSNLFVFGDSLVDSGNAQAARLASGGADPAPAAAGYFQGRFSNGYNFADYLSIAMGDGPATADAYGGLNFSVGGAQAREMAGDASPSFAEQIGRFADSGKVFDSQSLVLVTFGGNDVRSELNRFGIFVAAGGRPQDFVADFTASLAAFRAGLDSLYARGARNFIVTGLPNIGQIPDVTLRNLPVLSTVGETFSRQLNSGYNSLTNTDSLTGIDDVVGAFGGATGANAQFFDLFAYQQRINANPVAFGLPATLDRTSACLRIPGAAPDCDGLVYFDTIHPTRQLHEAIAGGLTTQLGIAAVPEPSNWLLMIAGFALVASTMRRRRFAVRVVYA